MPANHGMFRKGDAVRRAATPAQAVKFAATGWARDDTAGDDTPAVQPVEAPVQPPADLTIPDHNDEEEDQ